MKSKVYFDLNGLKDAVITAEIVLTKDVRDKIARTFKEELGYCSSLCTAFFVAHKNVQGDDAQDTVCAILEIKPVKESLLDTQELVATLSDPQLNRLRQAIEREYAFRERTKTGSKSYYYGQPVSDHYRDYSIEDAIPKV